MLSFHSVVFDMSHTSPFTPINSSGSPIMFCLVTVSQTPGGSEMDLVLKWTSYLSVTSQTTETSAALIN